MEVRNFGELYCSGKLMNIQELKIILTNKINDLNNKRNLSYQSGDLVSYEDLGNQIEEVQKIITKLDS